MERYLGNAIDADLAEKMVFLAGPRQVGKTTLARGLLTRAKSGVYYSWDQTEDRRRIRAAEWPSTPSLIVLDEIHKWRDWKRWIKGEYDTHRSRHRFLVTGSARLDVYRRGGDSLQGRYHHYRLHPLSVSEIMRFSTEAHPASGVIPAVYDIESVPQPFTEIPPITGSDADKAAAVLEQLLRRSGFPEPYLASSVRQWRRWRKERHARFFREDLRDTERVAELAQVQLLADLLSERVTSLTSVNALREDLGVSHNAVSHWLQVLSHLYYVFQVFPYASQRIKGLRKMPKTYLWDTTQVPDEAARFENIVALHLLKFCHYLEDYEGYRSALHYLRLRDGKEVDFLVTIDDKPWFAVEVKRTQGAVAPALAYFKDRLDIPYAYQISLHGQRSYCKNGIYLVPAGQLLAALV